MKKRRSASRREELMSTPASSTEDAWRKAMETEQTWRKALSTYNNGTNKVAVDPEEETLDLTADRGIGLVEPSVETMISELGGDQHKGSKLDSGDIAGEKEMAKRISLEPDEELQSSVGLECELEEKIKEESKMSEP
jgi:hypothetical protein